MIKDQKNTTEPGELTQYQEALLKKRRRDDEDKKKRVDARAKQKLDQGRQKKIADKQAKGDKGIIMPEVFVSNHMKQQRNFVHYKRNKNKIQFNEKASEKFGDSQALYHLASLSQTQKVNENSLLLAIRIKGLNDSTTPQTQKILSEIGLRQINNAVFLKADQDTIKKLLMVTEFISYGYPTKKTVVELIRKRGFLKKDGKKEAITNNLLIEELLGPESDKAGEEDDGHMGCICLEDVIDTVFNCRKPQNDGMFKRILKVLFPFQIGSLKESIEDSNVKHEAHSRDVRKKNTKVQKGGYIGFMGDDINKYIHSLI